MNFPWGFPVMKVPKSSNRRSQRNSYIPIAIMKVPRILFLSGGWFLPALALMFAMTFLLLLSACMEEPPGIVVPCAQPKGIQTYPANGDTNVPLAPVVTVTFDTLKNPSSFDSASIVLVHGTDTIGGTTSYNPTDTTLYFIPNDTLEPKQPYIVTVTVPTDLPPTGPVGPIGPGPSPDTTYTWTFTTQDSTTHDTIPVLPAPVPTQQGAGIYSLSHFILPDLNLDWFPDSGAISYRLQVSTSPVFATTLFDLSGIAPNSPLVYQPVAISLLPLGTYYYRVNATNSGGTSAFSAPLSFMIVP
jgi:hypothetical protein